MSTLHIYDSQGEQLDGKPADASQRIEDFFFDGVRLYLDTRGTPELIMFFRARESEAGRAEQYYAVYECDNTTGLFRRFERDLRTAVEDERDMQLQLTSDDVKLIDLLGKNLSVPGSTDQHGAISSLLTEGASLSFGVKSPEAAFGLVQQYIGSPAQQFAIVDDVSAESVANCDFVVQPGAETDLEPLGDTADAFDDRLQRTTANANRSRATEDPATTPADNSDRIETVGKNTAAVLAGIVGAALTAIVLLNAAAFIGISFPLFDPIVFI